MDILKKKEIYIYVGFFIAAIVFVVSTVSTMFAIIEIHIPELINNYYSYDNLQSGLARSLPFIIILLPIIAFAGRMIHRKESLAKFELKGIFMHLALLIISVVGILSLAKLMSSYFNGFLTLQIFLKTLALLGFLVLVGITVYCENKGIKEKLSKCAFYAVIVISLVTIIWGAILSNPTVQRDKKIDNINAQRVFEIAQNAKRYNDVFFRFPRSLDELVEYNSFVEPNHFMTEKQFEYSLLSGGREVEVCGDFLRDAMDRARKGRVNSYKMGRSCVKFDKNTLTNTFE